MEENVWRGISQDLPYKVRISKETHEQLKELKSRLKKSQAQIVIELVQELYNNETQW